jgi:hypothetical protein
MHYMVPLFFYTHNFEIEEVLHYIKELYKFSHKRIKNTLHSFSHGLIKFCECPTRAPIPTIQALHVDRCYGHKTHNIFTYEEAVVFSSQSLPPYESHTGDNTSFVIKRFANVSQQ